MLINLLLFLFTQLFLVWIGLACLRFLQINLPRLGIQAEQIPLSLTALIGLIASTFLAATISLLAPVDWPILILLLSLCLVYAVLDRRWLKQRWQSRGTFSLRNIISLMVLFGLIFVLVLATSADPDRSYDDGLYHLQSVLLITRHQAIPGLGLIHTRFAYNPIWHVTSALWGYRFLHPAAELYFIATPLLMLNFLAYLLRQIKKSSQIMLPGFSLGLLLFAISYMVYYRFDFGAVGNNLPSFILIWWAVLIFVSNLDPTLDKHEQEQANLLLPLITVFAIMVKLTAIMLLLPAGFLWYRSWKQSPVRSGILVSLAAMITLPWIARSLIASGYFLFPPPAAWFGLPFRWQMPFAMTQDRVVVDQNWSKGIQHLTADQQTPSWGNWIPQWFGQLDRNEALLFAAVGMAIFAFVLTLIIRRKRIHPANQAMVWYVLSLWMVFSTGFWFFTYPSPRFFYGPAMPIIASLWISLSLWLPLNWQKFPTWLIHGGAILTTMLLLLLFSRLNILSEIDYSRIMLHPAPFPQTEIRQITLHQFTLNLPVSGDQCWGAPVPCVPDKCSESVYLLGDTIFDGFRFEEKTP